jgi:protein transport protein SEC31
MQPVVKALRGLFDVCSAAVASAPGKKREMEDNSKRLGGLFWRLNKGDVTSSVAASLTQLAAALESRDFATASQIQVSW